MRWIIKRLKGRNEQDQRGATAVMTALLLVVLLAFAAIAIDVGVLYAKRAQLQNGADAGALAIAQDCAQGDCSPDDQTPESKAATLGVDNANGDPQQATTVEWPTSNSVTVQVNKNTAAGDGVQLFFAGLLGHSQADVEASATATWGGPSTGSGFPIAFSDCQFDLSGDMQLLMYKDLRPGYRCNRGESGLVVPGGFGSLEQNTGGCEAAIDTGVRGGWTNGRSGAAPPDNCKLVVESWIADINAGTPPTVLFPVFDETRGTGGGEFHIRGFAAFQVFGWRFTGSSPYLVFQSSGHATTPEDLNCNNPCRGIIGKFVEYVTFDAAYGSGGEDLGLRIVRLTK